MTGRRIIRVFPRRTRATPSDAYSCTGEPDLLVDLLEPSEVRISVTFTWDLQDAERLERAWRAVAPVTIGGPATGAAGGDFEPGMYLRPGYVITSRGCPNRCWFCSVWRREGGEIRELPIRDGWNVLDDNLLACSDEHVRSVFAMLHRQPRRPEFTGGLEAARLQDWHCQELRSLLPKQLFFAYDTPDDHEPLVDAGRKLLGAGFTTASHVLRCYVLIGHPRDTFDQAERRLVQAMDAGFMPMAMLYRGDSGETSREWRQFQRSWARPMIVATKLRGAII